MKFSIFQDSRVGGRKYNQDRVAYSYTRDALLLVVADGMGGHLHGEIASQITVELMAQLFQRKARPTVTNPTQFLSDAFNKCHDAIFDYAANHQMLETPRTTLVACLIQDGMAYWAHVGDSRLYLIRDGKLLTRTKDHSKVQQMVDAGKLTPEQAEIHPEKNKIYNCLGSAYAPDVEIGGKIPMQENDSIILCTDGLWGLLSEPEMVQFLSSYPVLYALPQLMDRAELRGGRHGDNLSALAINWHEDEDETVTAVSTQKLERDAVTTQLNTLAQQKHIKENKDISEIDVDAAIAEIQAVLKKYGK